MKLLYIAPRDFPRRVANRVQTIKMAEAFSRVTDLTLCVSKLHLTRAELWQYYGVEHPFDIREWGTSPFGRQSLYSLLPALWQIKKIRPDVIFFREEQIGWLLSFFIRDYIYEMHAIQGPLDRYYNRLVRRSKKTIVVSEGLKQAGIARGMAEDKIEVHPAGVDLAAFDLDIDTKDARDRVGLPSDKKIVLYSGRLSAWKGVETLLMSAAYLPTDTRIVFLGGFEGEPESLQAKAVSMGLEDRIEILGTRPHGEVPLFLKAADVLVVPNVPVTTESSEFTSPLKLLEYMSARKPIVASDLPSLREIVDERSATLVQPGDAKALASGIMRALAGGADIEKGVSLAFERASDSSWDARARRILASVTDEPTVS